MSEIVTNLSCYVHLPCNRSGLALVCLDWREICDEKVDCIDGGMDEKDCEQLEVNECKDNEYRCHYGQCIPEEFLHDDDLNPECLDGTDEPIHYSYLSSCPYDPSFRCENIRCHSSKSYVLNCGDGQCMFRGCWNKRDVLFMGMMLEATVHISEACRNAMSCLTIVEYCKINVSLNDICPDLFAFPETPVIFDHVHLYYKGKSWNTSLSQYILPELICFNHGLCPFLDSFVFNRTYLSCQLARNLLRFYHMIDSWAFLMNELYSLFRTCAIDSNVYIQPNPMLYQCKGSTKSISNHRLLDGIQDCFYNDDEKYLHSCTLPKSRHRLPCDQKCFSPIVIQDVFPNCMAGEDEESSHERKTRQQIFFQTMCDGFIELDPPISINGEAHTDEGECHFWPCNNTYTRCNHLWNCINGEDEVNCSSSICPELGHPCVSPTDYSFFCLAIERAGDGVVDCLGASDERHLCRIHANDDPTRRFLCRGNSTCASAVQLCDEKPDCEYAEDESYCHLGPNCKAFDVSRIREKDFLCSLNDDTKRKFVPLSLENSRSYPHHLQFMREPTSEPDRKIQYNVATKEQTESLHDKQLTHWVWLCHRGITVRVIQVNMTSSMLCLCPPSYCGDLCQYQNQRVSITMRVKASFVRSTLFRFVLTLIDDEERTINSNHQFSYFVTHACGTKYNVHLLYATRPKNLSRNYSVHIDAYNGYTLKYHTSWLFPIEFAFLPVYRMALELVIPRQIAKSCSLNCGSHGHCLQYYATEKYFCQCDSGWSGSQCQRQHACHCAPDSLCIGPSMCLCPVNKFGPRCYLKMNPCQSDPCKNNGTCTSYSEVSFHYKVCLCPDGFFGDRCQFESNRIQITFRQGTVPALILIHFIEVYGDERSHNRSTVQKKIGLYDRSVTIHRASAFHIAFVQMNDDYYLIVLQEQSVMFAKISVDLNAAPRCSSIDELFNKTFTQWHLIRRIKYYHLPCQKRPDLVCFYDDSQMCLCNEDQHANCFGFDHNTTYPCQDPTYCKRNGQCFQNDPFCPTSAICICLECYYGSQCQFSTEDIRLSLDAILGYHILANISLSNQPFVTKISITINMIIAVFGSLDSSLAIITFRRKQIRSIGCGVYLLTSAVGSLFAMVVLTFKLWILVLAQMNTVTNRFFLQIQCKSIDYVLRVFVNTIDWLNVCVSVERLVTVIKGPSFDQLKSKRVSKYVILCIILFTTSTAIQDPLYRDLIEDQEEEERLWCLLMFSASLLQTFDSIVIYFHSIGPFIINMISTLTLIIISAKRRVKIQQRLTYSQHLRQQFQQHKHLLISSSILMLLILPRLIISSISTCLQSPRDPWLPLVGYFVSYIPSALTFVVFVLPSETYRKEFKMALKPRRRR